MDDKYLDRLAMHRTVAETLDKPEHKAVWLGNPPAIFTTKVAVFQLSVARLGDLVSQHEAELRGIAEQKLTEEQELEDAAYEIGSALAAYYDDHNDAAKSQEVELSRSGWRRLRDEQLLARAKRVLLRLNEELAAPVTPLAPYALAAADATLLQKEIADYEKIIRSPQTAISIRRALSLSLRPSFREVSDLLSSMDKLVLRFGGTPAGQTFVGNFQSARIIRNSGGNTGPAAPPVAPSTPPAPAS